MPSPKRSSPALEAQDGDQPRGQSGDQAGSQSDDVSEALVAAAEAEAAAAEAKARATAARARALRLSRDADESADASANAEVATGATDAAPADHAAIAESADGDGDQTADEDTHDRGIPDDAVSSAPGTPRRRWLHRPQWKTVAAAAGIVVICASAGASGGLLWHHRNVVHQQQRAAEYSAAARQIAVDLLSIDFTSAKDSVQRVLDNSTGKFKEDYQAGADALVRQLEQSKVVVDTSVSDVAVESMTNDSAVVLVAANTKLNSPDPAARQPKLWRLGLTLTRDGGKLKVSKVEFV
jgi:Mce-associated membrane protein